MAMLGKPVLVASRALYECGSHFLTVRSKESLPGMLERCLHASPDREIQREAFRLAFYYIFVFELPFPAVSVSDIYEAELNYARREDLASGKDDSLDRICNFLINGRALFDRPTMEEGSRTTAAEDVFFAELAHSPGYLRSARYERWLQAQALGRSTTDLVRRFPFGAGQALLNLGRRRWKAFLTLLEGKA